MFTLVRLYTWRTGTPPADHLVEQWIANSVYYDALADAIAAGPDGDTLPAAMRFRVLAGGVVVYDSATDPAPAQQHFA